MCVLLATSVRCETDIFKNLYMHTVEMIVKASLLAVIINHIANVDVWRK